MANNQSKQRKQESPATFEKEGAEFDRIQDKLHANLHTSLTEAVEVGRILVEVKTRPGHGKFQAWMGKNLRCAPRQHAAIYGCTRTARC
jgi:hypothetical protein